MDKMTEYEWSCNRRLFNIFKSDLKKEIRLITMMICFIRMALERPTSSTCLFHIDTFHLWDVNITSLPSISFGNINKIRQAWMYWGSEKSPMQFYLLMCLKGNNVASAYYLDTKDGFLLSCSACMCRDEWIEYMSGLIVKGIVPQVVYNGVALKLSLHCRGWE